MPSLLFEQALLLLGSALLIGASSLPFLLLLLILSALLLGIATLSCRLALLIESASVVFPLS